jgi:hypothetical protein
MEFWMSFPLARKTPSDYHQARQLQGLQQFFFQLSQNQKQLPWKLQRCGVHPALFALE